MKKILSIFLLLISFSAFSQDEGTGNHAKDGVIPGIDYRTILSGGNGILYNPGSGIFGMDSTGILNIPLSNLLALPSVPLGRRYRITTPGATGEVKVSSDQVTTADGGWRYATTGGTIVERTDTSSPQPGWWMANGYTFTNATKTAATLFSKFTVPYGTSFTLQDSIHTGKLQNIFIYGTITQQVADSAKTMFITDQAGVQFFGGRTGRLIGSVASGTGAYVGSRVGIMSYYDNLLVDGLYIKKQSAINTLNANGLYITNDTLISSEMAVHAWANVGITRSNVYMYNCYAAIDNRTAAYDNQERGFRTTNMKGIVVDHCTSLGFQLSGEFWNSTTGPDSGIVYSTRNYFTNNTVDNYISMVSGVTDCLNNNLDYSLRPSNAAPVPTNSTLPVGIEMGGTIGGNFNGNHIKNFPGVAMFATTPASTYNGFPYAAIRTHVMYNEIFNCGRSDHAEMPAISIGCGAYMDISHNLIKDSKTTGIAIVGITNLPQLTHDIVVSYNQIYNNYGHAIYTGYCTNVTISNNNVDSTVIGDGVHTGSAPDFNIVVENNKFTRCVYGIWAGTTFGNSHFWNNTTYGNRTSNLRSFNTTGLSSFFKGNTAVPGAFLPEGGSWEIGMNYEVQSATAPLFVVTAAGTNGTIPTTTANTVSGSQQIVVSSKSPYVQPGQYVDITGNTATLKIASISADSTIWTVTGTVNATLTGATVAWHPATFAQQFTLTAVDQNPIPGNKTFSGRLVASRLIAGDTVQSTGGPVIAATDVRVGARIIAPVLSDFHTNISTAGGTSLLMRNNSNGLVLTIDSTDFATTLPRFQHDTTVAANYTASLLDYHIHVNGTSGSVQVTAPAYSTMTKTGPDLKKYVASFVVSRNDANLASAVTVVPSGANKFIQAGDSVTSISIQPGEVYTFTATGTSTTGYYKVAVAEGKNNLNTSGAYGVVTFSGNGATTSFVYAHGLAGITSGSFVTAFPNTAAAAGLSYVTVDATNVTFFYTVAPVTGSSNVKLSVHVKP